MAAAYTPIPLDLDKDERIEFWRHVRMRPGVIECWIWRPAREGSYGSHRLRGQNVPAHRLAYALAYGRDPGALLVRHSCDVRACCNPRHLHPGSDADNGADRAVAEFMAGMSEIRIAPVGPRTDWLVANIRHAAVTPNFIRARPLNIRKSEAARRGHAKRREAAAIAAADVVHVSTVAIPATARTLSHFADASQCFAGVV